MHAGGDVLTGAHQLRSILLRRRSGSCHNAPAGNLCIGGRMKFKNYLPVHIFVVIGAMCLTGFNPAGVASVATVVLYLWISGAKS